MWHPWKKLFNVRHLSHFLGGKTPESHMSLHGTGERDDALSDFHADFRLLHARLPAGFAQHVLMDCSSLFATMTQSPFLRVRGLCGRPLLSVSRRFAGAATTPWRAAGTGCMILSAKDLPIEKGAGMQAVR